YWLVTTVFGLIVALFDWAALLIIGVPLAGVWALFSFLTNYIPNIGFIIGVIPPALLALFGDGWVAALAVIIAYSVLNFVIQSIIQPKFAGDAVGLTPTMSFVSLLLWGWVFGALGTLIALPCSLLVKATLIDHDPGARWANALISSRPTEGLEDNPDEEHADLVEDR
ncbi:MAG: AI-2E family transporter, partial [Cutibacterium avidum]|nr:AI-2E family transporter [Cutibacterium avidum]